MAKPIVFISHITQEKEIALALKKLVESAFIGMMDVFVSSDPRSIHLGQEWLQKIKFGLANCAVEIIIASPQSVKRPWINFEAGAGWIREIPVIPLCHSGMEPGKLPHPLQALQGATATEETQLNLILPVLAESLGSAVPKIDFTEFIATVEAFEQTTKDNLKVAGRTAVPDEDTNELMPHEMATFMAVAELDEIDRPASVTRVIKHLEDYYTAIAVKLALKMLERKDFIIVCDVQTYHEEYRGVRLSEPGWEWLIANSNILTLEVRREPDDFPEPRRRRPPRHLQTPPERTPPPTDGDDIPF